MFNGSNGYGSMTLILQKYRASDATVVLYIHVNKVLHIILYITKVRITDLHIKREDNKTPEMVETKELFIKEIESIIGNYFHETVSHTENQHIHNTYDLLLKMMTYYWMMRPQWTKISMLTPYLKDNDNLVGAKIPLEH